MIISNVEPTMGSRGSKVQLPEEIAPKTAEAPVVKAKEQCHNTLHGKKGLRERITMAKDPLELQNLLKESETYTGASAKTRKGWVRAAEAVRRAGFPRLPDGGGK